jgi:MFS family permease
LQTIISTALPVIASQFHASESGYSWIASSYLLANAACIPLWGKLSDIWGRKNIILLANVAFLVGSLICALAKNMAMIVAGRAVQGVGGGGIIILANISVTDLFSVRYENPIVCVLNATDFNPEIVPCTTVSLERLGPLQVH